MPGSLQYPAPHLTYQAEVSKAQVQQWLADRDKALKDGYSEQGYKFSDPAEADKFKALLAAGGKLQAGASFGSDGEYQVVRAGSTPSGYQEVGRVNSTLANPYASRKVTVMGKNVTPGQSLDGKPLNPGNPFGDPNGPFARWVPNEGFDPVERQYDPVKDYTGPSQDDLRIVRRGSMAAPSAEAPKPFEPTPELAAARDRAQAYGASRPAPAAADDGALSSGSGSGPYTDDLIANINRIDARAGGYQRRFLNDFLPGLKAHSEAASREVGEVGRYALGQLDPAIQPPVLSDPFKDSGTIADNSLFGQLQKRIKEA